MITSFVAMVLSLAPVAQPIAADGGQRRLLVLDFKGDVDPALRGLAQRSVTEALTARGDDEVLSTHDIASMLDAEAEKQATGCDGASECLAEIAGALGAAVVVSGEVTSAGDAMIIQLSMLEPSSARVLGRGSARATSADGIPAAARTAVRLLMDGPAAWPLPLAIAGGAIAAVGGAVAVVGAIPFVMAVSAQGTADRLVTEKADPAAFADNHAAFTAAADQWSTWGAPLVIVGSAVVVTGVVGAVVGGLALE